MRTIVITCGISLFLCLHARAGVSHAQFEKFVADQIRQKNISISPLEVRIEDQLVMKRGGERLDKGGEESMYSILLDAECKHYSGVQLAQKTSIKGLRSVIEPANKRAAEMVGQMLNLAKDVTEKNPSDLKQLEEIDEKIEQDYDDAISEYAKSVGLKRGYGAEKSEITISIQSDPDSATISYIPAGEIDLYKLASSKGEKWPEPQWTVPADRSDIAVSGRVWIAADWPGPPKKSYKERIYITKSIKLVVTFTGFHTEK